MRDTVLVAVAIGIVALMGQGLFLSSRARDGRALTKAVERIAGTIEAQAKGACTCDMPSCIRERGGK